jgi:hypothetical protein
MFVIGRQLCRPFYEHSRPHVSAVVACFIIIYPFYRDYFCLPLNTYTWLLSLQHPPLPKKALRELQLQFCTSHTFAHKVSWAIIVIPAPRLLLYLLALAFI